MSPEVKTWRERLAEAYLAWAIRYIAQKNIAPNDHSDPENAEMYEQSVRFLKRDREKLLP